MIVGHRDERFRQGLESESGTKCKVIFDFFNSKDPECGVSSDTIVKFMIRRNGAKADSYGHSSARK